LRRVAIGTLWEFSTGGADFICKWTASGTEMWNRAYDIGQSETTADLRVSNGALFSVGSAQPFETDPAQDDLRVSAYDPYGRTCMREHEGPGFGSWSPAQERITLASATGDISPATWSPSVVPLDLPHTSTCDAHLAAVGARWTFQEGTGTVVHDVTPNENHGVNSGGAWIQYPGYWALRLVDDGDRVTSISRTFDDGAVQGFTISAGLEELFPATTSRYIVDARSSDRGFLLQIGEDQLLRLNVYGPNGQSQELAGGEVPAGGFCCVAASFDRLAGQLLLFIDGEVVASTTANFDYSQTEMSAAIGNNRWSDAPRPLKGDISSVVFYDQPVPPDACGGLTGLPPVVPGRSLAAEGIFLGAPAPNPTTGRTEIRFRLPSEGPVELAVWDVGGRRVAEVWSGTVSAGEHLMVWDGKDLRGRQAPAGAYLVRLSVGADVRTQPVRLVR